MEDFKNVTVIPQANVYFDGKVSSRTMVLQDGSRKTLGFMLPGEYSFGTSQEEVMEVIAGEMDVKLPGQDSWKTYSAGESYKVAANCQFEVKVKDFADYCCSYA